MMHTTKLIILAVIALLLAREAYVLLVHVPKGTISEAVWDWNRSYPIVPLAVGILIGHFFWQSPKSAKETK